MSITVADLRTQLGYEDGQTEDDLALADVLAAALVVIGKQVGSLVPGEVTETVTASCGTGILSSWPVLSITSPTGLTVTRSGVVTGLSSGDTEIVYTAGAEPDASQKMAVLLVAADIWETRRGQGFPQDDTGQYVITPLLHRRVRELLAGGFSTA